MDLVYVLKNDNNYEDLRNSLRSLERYGENYDRVFIIGGRPDFLDYSKIIHFSHSDDYSLACNIFKKIIYLINNSDISEDFILFNDDFYLLKNIDLSKTPYYYKRDQISTTYQSNNTYNEMALKTREFLLKNNKRIYDFKVHYPIIYNKTKFKEIESLFEEYIKISPLGLSVRDLYGNWHNVPNKVFKKDNKIMPNTNFYEFIKDLDLFSGSNNPKEEEKQFLDYKFNTKSKWEI